MKKILLLCALLWVPASLSVAEQHDHTKQAKGKGDVNGSQAPEAEVRDKTLDVEVKVNGMVCDFCAQGIEKTLGKQKAVESLNVNLDTGTVGIDFASEMQLSDAEITKAIEDNGLSVVSISRSSPN